MAESILPLGFGVVFAGAKPPLTFARMRVLVTGSSGFIGEKVCSVLARAGHEVVRTARKEAPGAVALDLAQPESLPSVLDEASPDAIIHTAAVRDLATSGQPALQFIPTGEELAKLERQWPGLYRSFNLPANAYTGQAAAVSGLGVANVLVVSSKLKDEQVKAALEGIFNNLEEVQKIHPEARRLTLAGAAAKSAVPLHRAAEAFYKARGVLS
jgi:NAD(P)-dependent dehydrogenase (short-subunit alcohol dehydrogenase family)